MEPVALVGVDLAKDVIVACGADARGRILECRAMDPAGFARWLGGLAACKIAFEASATAHHWARTARACGHDARLVAADHAARFRRQRTAKNDRNDAEAVLLALQHPETRFVAVKCADQQAMLAWHVARQGYTHDRTALINRLRGMMAEFGVWHPRRASVLLRALPTMVCDETLPAQFRPLLSCGLEQLQALAERIAECDLRIRAHVRDCEAARRLLALTGVGRLTASALVATVANAGDFRNGRQLAAWTGLVPRQYSTGGKPRLGRITRRGNHYLRALLVQGARSAMQSALMRTPPARTRLQAWMVALHGRAGYHKALVAIANKHARILWALLAHGASYDPLGRGQPGHGENLANYVARHEPAA